MIQAIALHGMFSEEIQNCGLWNIFDGKQASPEQMHDLLSFRKTGQEAFEQYISRKFLRIASTNAPVRKKQLCTFTISRTRRKRVNLIEQESKLLQRYLKRQLAWVAEHQPERVQLEELFGPISSLPRALADKNGLPYKAAKSNTTAFLQKRYKDMPAIATVLPKQWTPDTVIIEGMFLIHTAPIPTMSSMHEYVHLLLMKHVRPHFVAGVLEVHVLFDNTGCMAQSPSKCEEMHPVSWQIIPAYSLVAC